ncbi:MAG: diaminopimelate dehydrogenase [Oscillospiraceae bacterium]|nr:diaminopimelate dehydrogenase [Oscillospiraceae bacterium]
MVMIKTAIIGFGNVGKCAYEAIQNAPDMTLSCIVKRQSAADIPPHLNDIRVTDIKDIRANGDVDAAVICLPSRMCPDTAESLMNMGIFTVDSYDIHKSILSEKLRLDTVAQKNNVSGVIAAGWDPGTDSVLRALMEAMTPRGITYTNFGPGMSMGHSVAAKAAEGVENALSMTMPAGAGVHRRIVYIQLKPGADFAAAAAAIKNDPYFINDDTNVIQVEDIDTLIDVGSGSHIIRKGVSGSTHNQIMEFSMKINNPALTAQVLVSAARAAVKQPPGCYTLIEIPVIDMLPGDRNDLISRLV